MARASLLVPPRVLAAFFNKVDVGGPDECWLWLRSIGSHGYGQIGWCSDGGRTIVTTAHRVAWICVFGDIGIGTVVRQTCANRLCENPGHLETVSAALAYWEFAANNRDKTACPAGHPYEGENLMLRPGERRCRACALERRRERSRQARALNEFYRGFEARLAREFETDRGRLEHDLEQVVA